MLNGKRKMPAVIFSVVLSCLLILVLFFDNYFMTFGFSEKDLLGRDFPAQMNIVEERLNFKGRERTIYDYRVIVKGDNDLLMSFVRSLDLIELNPDDYIGRRYIDRTVGRWWIPPSTEGETGFKFYQKTNTATWDEENLLVYLIEVEVFEDTLFLVQFGGIDALKNRREERKRRAWRTVEREKGSGRTL